MSNEFSIERVKNLLEAYKTGLLGDITMPEETHPVFNNQEQKLVYFTFPMALNYQRNSYKLWESALATWNDIETKPVFDIDSVSKMKKEDLRILLTKYKLALQPNKHSDTWFRLAKIIYDNWGSITELLKASEYDFLKLKDLVQIKYKKDFPYLSGPKIFNYWSYIIQEYGGVELANRSYIEIAPDTHVIQASVKLGVIDQLEVDHITREEISRRWREYLKDSGIDPIDVHSPLWFWSRGGFKVDM